MAKKLMFAIEVDDKGTPTLKKFNRETDKADTKTKKLSRSLVSGVRDMGSLARSTAKAAGKVALLGAKMGLLAGAAGIGAVIVGFMGLKSVMTEVIGLATEQERVETRLAAVIKATGQSAGFNIDQMKKMAAGMQEVTTAGDEVILGGMGILATFKNIKGEAFKRTAMLALDLSEVLGTDLKSSMLMLGKAMNDPIANLSALSRAGIQFTAEVKDQVKALWEAGDVMGAHNIILKALEGQFGGTAKAATGIFGGALEQLYNVYGDLKEEIGFIITKNKAFIDLIHKGTATIKGWIGNISDWADANQLLITSTIIEWADMLSSKIKSVWTNTWGTVKAARDWYTANKSLADSSLLTYLRALYDIGKLVWGIFEGIGKAVGWAAAKIAEFNDSVEANYAYKTVSFLGEGSSVKPLSEKITEMAGKLSSFDKSISSKNPELVVGFRQNGVDNTGVINANISQGQKGNIQSGNELNMVPQQAIGQGGPTYNISLNPGIMTGTREGITTAISDIKSQMERYA